MYHNKKLCQIFCQFYMKKIILILALAVLFFGVSVPNVKAYNLSDLFNLSAAIRAVQSQIAKLQSAIPVSKMKAQLAPTDGLVGHWKFDETSGATAADSAGGNNGISINGATWTTGKIGNALSFDGADDYVNVGSAASVDNLGPLTYSAWIYVRSVPNANGAFIFAKDYSKYFYIGQSSHALRFVVDYDNVNLSLQSSADNNIPFSAWTHVAVTWDGSTTAANAHLYINGVETSYSAKTDAVGNLVSDASYSYKFSFSSRPFDGIMDDARIYNRALSASEITDLYNYTGGTTSLPINGVCGTTSNSCVASDFVDVSDTTTNYLWQCLGSNGGTDVSCSLEIPIPDNSNSMVGWWKFDETSGMIAADSSGKNNAGTLASGPTWATNGKFNGALSFDGLDDYVNVGSGICSQI